MAENFQELAQNELLLSRNSPCKLLKWKVSVAQKVSKGSILAVYKKLSSEFCKESEIVVLPKLKSKVGGLVKRLLVNEGDHVRPGQAVILLDVCEHKTVMKEMCAECGADLRQEPGIPGILKEPVSASVALVHNIPELRVSQQEAEILARKDKDTLLRNEKLVLLVDLDQTLIHTTTENVPPDMKDVYHFQLSGQNCWYHTKFRPGWRKFLEDMSKHFELHIFTMGSRMYAHTIARMLDPDSVLFADRIRSRDESFDMFSKYRDLRALFPCDDSMVCIIDDREDIWDSAPNLVSVKPYRFFTGTGDINAPPGSNQAFTHAPAIPLHENAVEAERKTTTGGKDGDFNKKEEIDQKESKDDEVSSTKDSSGVAEKYGSSEEKREVQELNHNEKLTSDEETDKEECNGETVKEKKENGEVSEEQVNDAQENSSSNEEAYSREPERPNDEDVKDENHIEDHDDYLLYLEEILRRIHSSFYEVVAWNKQADDSCTRVAPDLRKIVPELRRNVLKATNVVFTGVIPRNCRPEDSQAWKIAEQFGASVSNELLTQKNTRDRSKHTTHVIAANPGTEKACKAIRLPSVHLVNPNWLWTCAERWEWVEELLYPVEDYHEYKARKNDSPTSSQRGTPKVSPKNSKVDSLDENADDDGTEHITDENLKIVLNPFPSLPFLSFSSGEMEAMDKEVEELMKSSDEEDDKDEQILGSVSSSSNSIEMDQSLEIDSSPDGIALDAFKGRTVDFSTIKQKQTRYDNDDAGIPMKRRKLDFVGKSDDGIKEGSDDEGSEGQLSSDGISSGSNSGDDEGSDMAAMLEAALS